MDYEKIGNFIRESRKKKNMTQEELAEKLVVSNRTISRWENSKCMPDYSLIRALCSELDISPNELLCGEKLGDNNYKNKTNENIDNILNEYYKMKKQRKIFKNLLLILILLFGFYVIKTLILFGIISFSFFSPADKVSGIDNYSKSYYLENYDDLNSTLSIFPDDISKMIEPTFISSFSTDLFDIKGYLLLKTKYSENDFYNEIERLSTIELSISNCSGDLKTNKVIYDLNSYKYPAYITIDGFDHKYEYALVDKDNLSIVYIYLSSPNTSDQTYNEYLKKNQNEYYKLDSLDKYSIYSHSFDNGQSWVEFDDCE